MLKHNNLNWWFIPLSKLPIFPSSRWDNPIYALPTYGETVSKTMEHLPFRDDFPMNTY